jgi:hypothetical protein
MPDEIVAVVPPFTATINTRSLQCATRQTTLHEIALRRLGDKIALNSHKNHIMHSLPHAPSRQSSGSPTVLLLQSCGQNTKKDPFSCLTLNSAQTEQHDCCTAPHYCPSIYLGTEARISQPQIKNVIGLLLT